ncbi:hypothetical protein M413DRAFT_440888 [Hebeloma cylindrosporum]|uniref:Transcription initiation factor TFIID subunit 8 n=1 Tax=Hebeloma cylindrosporum TaxID=76867 RepID=A0A0C3CPQ2_HEBCY|nr:hypothetical protein M413DRAFT_440888 [Hebeloma cylindrosporum h7]
MYQPDTTYGATSYYPNQYQAANPTVATTAIPYFQYAPQTIPKHLLPVELSPPDPTEPSVTPDVASIAMQRLVSYELRNAGFERAAQPAVQRLEREVGTFVQQLFQRAHEYANLANRASAIASDVLLACEEFHIPPKMGSDVERAPATLLPPRSRSPSPELLGSDDEDAPSTVPTTLRNLPEYFPSLPPKHTYLQTPASPPKKAALPSLQKKLKTAALVQESLQNLLLATEDSMNQEDGELLGHLVNWEMNTQPRKRWRVGAK